MNRQDIIRWLLQGDVSIQYQVYRDLLDLQRDDLQSRIEEEGWGSRFLSLRKPQGNWGDSFYQPKWISTHYTLLDLRHLQLRSNHPLVKESIEQIIDTLVAEDGGIMLGPSTEQRSDVCVNGMFLNYASYFKTPEQDLRSVVDGILNEKMPDGGFNCRSTRGGAKHSSMHTTLSVLEGFLEFLKAGYKYRYVDISAAIESSEEFLLLHHLFHSDRTGAIIHKDFLKFAFPGRWKYDILRAMDYFQQAGRKWDSRMGEALKIIREKQNKDGTWNMQAAHPGKQYFVMEKAGRPGRWNTLRALRVLKYVSQMEHMSNRPEVNSVRIH